MEYTLGCLKEFLLTRSDDTVFSCLRNAFKVWCYVKFTVAMRAGLCVVSFSEASSLGKCCIVLSDVSWVACDLVLLGWFQRAFHMLCSCTFFVGMSFWTAESLVWRCFFLLFDVYSKFASWLFFFVVDVWRFYGFSLSCSEFRDVLFFSVFFVFFWRISFCFV